MCSPTRSLPLPPPASCLGHAGAAGVQPNSQPPAAASCAAPACHIWRLRACTSTQIEVLAGAATWLMRDQLPPTLCLLLPCHRRPWARDPAARVWLPCHLAPCSCQSLECPDQHFLFTSHRPWGPKSCHLSTAARLPRSQLKLPCSSCRPGGRASRRRSSRRSRARQQAKPWQQLGPARRRQQLRRQRNVWRLLTWRGRRTCTQPRCVCPNRHQTWPQCRFETTAGTAASDVGCCTSHHAA